MKFVQATLAVTVAAGLLGTGAAQAHERDPLLRFLDRIIVDVRGGYRVGRDDDDDDGRGFRRGRDDDDDDDDGRDDNDDHDRRDDDDDDGRGDDDDD